MKNYKIDPIIDVTELILLADKRKPIDVYDLMYQSERLYLGIKAEGVRRVKLCYYSDEDKTNKIEIIGTELSKMARAVAALTTRLRHRFSYNDGGRLERRFGLTPEEADHMLGDIKGYKRGSYGNIQIDELMTVQDIVDSLVKTA